MITAYAIIVLLCFLLSTYSSGDELLKEKSSTPRPVSLGAVLLSLGMVFFSLLVLFS